MVAVMTLSVNLQADERRNGVNLRDEVLEVRVYPVADLVVPLPPGDQSKPEFAALMRYLRASTGEDVWNGGGSIQSAEKTLSLAIRQRSSVHEKIADALNELRGELSAQVSLEFRVVSGPRRDIAALAEAFPGELGKYEAEQLQQRITASNKFNLLF
ncbi:MAG TPA: hypothetical protein VFG20_17810, partial [Planctomycetaceae bacterium]|nr:hypothetical protein [Planctomycetaceae bacterium]